MDSRPITMRRAKLGQVKVTRQRSLHHFEDNNFISCLAGLYSCQWESEEQKKTKPGHCCCSIGECMFFAVLLLTFFLWFIFTYLWGQIKNDYNAFDRFNFAHLGFWFHWSILLLVSAILFFSYLLFLLILAVCLMIESQQLYLHWFHKMLTIFILGLSVIAYILLTVLWPQQWWTLCLSFQVTAPFLHMGVILVMVFVGWPVALHFFRTDNKVLQVVIIVPYLMILLFFYFIPLGVYSPCIREKGTLGPKPALIGHRGAPMLAPENTEMSFRKAVEHGAYGFETDVRISYDGVMFLMHDRTLRRITEIETLDPGSVNVDAAMFRWEYLKKLNAGKWFFVNRPFYHMPPLSVQDEAEAKKQTIYKFSDFLNLAGQENKYVIFDLYRPPKFHPYRDNWINKTLEVLLNESKIRPNLVLWLPEPDRSHVRSVAPGFQQVSSVAKPIEELQKQNIVKLNVDYKTMARTNIKKYSDANITTNLWVVSEPWVFSLAWCYGAHSVTTNAAQNLRHIHQPLFLMTPQEYRSMWIVTNVLSVLFTSLVFVIHWWREVGSACCETESNENVEHGLYSKFGTELSTMHL